MPKTIARPVSSQPTKEQQKCGRQCNVDYTCWAGWIAVTCLLISRSRIRIRDTCTRVIGTRTLFRIQQTVVGMGAVLNSDTAVDELVAL